jgi:hypothetical protein
MTVDTAQYTEFFQQGQDAVRKTVDTWTRTVQNAAAQLPAFAPQFDADTAIDRYFDFTEKVIEAQRDVAKKFVGYVTAAGAVVRETAETVTKAATKA